MGTAMSRDRGAECAEIDCEAEPVSGSAYCLEHTLELTDLIREVRKGGESNG